MLPVPAVPRAAGSLHPPAASREATDRSRDYGNLPPGASTDQTDRRNIAAELDKKVVVYRAGKLPSNIPKWFKDYDIDGDGQIALYEWKEKEGTVAEFRKLDLN